jgi:putative transposase
MFCGLFGYSRQAYYKHNRAVGARVEEEQRMVEVVLSVRRTMPRLGGRKLHHLIGPVLEAEGIGIGRDRLFALLRRHNLLVPKRKSYHKTTDSHHWMRRYPNRIRDVVPTRPEQVWVADITYLAGRRQPRYLHLVTDAYSKQIMGYEVSLGLDANSTLKALTMAIRHRQYPDRSLIHHSDRGLQYCSQRYTGTLSRQAIRISMTEDSSPYDNAVAERVNGILKQEFGLEDLPDQWKDVRKVTAESIAIYNQLRPHLSCHYLTPEQMHCQDKLPVITWRKKKTPTETTMVGDP